MQVFAASLPLGWPGRNLAMVLRREDLMVSRTFSNTGALIYHRTIHPNTVGTVRVQ